MSRYAVKVPFLVSVVLSVTGMATLSALVAFASVTLRAGAASAGDDAKCTIATKGDSPTAKACAKGGRAEAKKVMKEMVKVAKGKGQKFTCDGCHKNLDDYALTKNGADDFKKLEDVTGMK